jgi:osmoprotectant transport system substrate-binding protein
VNIRRTIPLVLAPLLVLAAACGDDDDNSSSATTAAAVTTVAGRATTTAAPGASTPTSGGAGGKIVVGSADFPESQVLAQIYGQALAKAGFDVDYQMAIGAREVYYKAIESGEIDLVPEYTNSLLTYLLRLKDPAAVSDAKNVEEQVADLGKELPDTLEVLTPSTAEDKDVIGCTADAAKKYNLTDLTSLGKASKDITIGAPPEFENRSPFGLVGLKNNYGAEFKSFVPLQFSAIADALSAGQIDCGNLLSTSSVIKSEGFVALKDDKNTVQNEAVLPLVRKAAVTPELESTLDGINASLDTEKLIEFNAKVDVDAAAPDVVAKEYLDSLG